MLCSRFLTVLSFLLATACQSNSQSSVSAPAVANPPDCDCCVFDERHPTSWQTRIAPDTAKGQPLTISGTVYESDGKTPARNVLMYFYHTNAQGRYAKLGTENRSSHAWWHGYCRGWLKTNDAGQYQITTIRPGPYPNRDIPAHIHFYVNAPTQKTCYYLSDFVFADDPLVTESYWYKTEISEGFLRYGGVPLTNRHDTLVGHRDIRLLPQYDRKPAQSGLLVGDECPAFDPAHVWGPDRGKRTCPMCAYGRGKGVMIWTKSVSSDTLRRIAQFWEAELQKPTAGLPGAGPLNAFIIYTNPDRKPARDVEQMLETFANEAGLHKVAVLYVPSPTDRKTALLYNVNPAVAITILGYKHRRVVSKFIDPSATEQTLREQRNSVE